MRHEHPSPPPSLAVTDDRDLRFAARELEAARGALAAAHAIAYRFDRDEAIQVAIAKLALASRAIDEVVERRQAP